MTDVVLYTKDYCPFCRRAKALLAAKSIGFTEHEVTNDPAKFEEMVERSGRRTVPQIFINGRHIGGSDELAALEAKGGLDPLLEDRAA